MVTPHQLDLKAASIQDLYQSLEQELIRLVILRLTTKTTTELSKDTVFQWYFEKLNDLHALNWQTIDRIVKSNSKMTKDQLARLIIDDGLKIADEADEEFANLMDTNRKNWSDIDQILNGYFDQQWLDIDNHVNQTLISRNYKYNPLAQLYQQVLSDTVTKVITGLVDPKKAFRNAIYDLVKKGIKLTLTDAAGRQWTLESYVKMVLKSTTRRVFNQLRLDRATDYGIVTALMSSHAAAREACSQIQGGWVLTVPTNEAPLEFRTIKSIYDYGYGDPGGTQGINCNHRLYPGIPGVTENNMPKPPTVEEAQANAKIIAKQRRLEVSIREAKRMLNAAKALGSQSDVTHFNVLIRNRQSALRQFIRDHEDLLHRDYSREQVYS